VTVTFCTIVTPGYLAMPTPWPAIYVAWHHFWASCVVTARLDYHI